MTTMLEATEAKRASPAPAEKAARSMSAPCVGRRLSMKRTSFGISEAEFSKKLGIGSGDLTAYEQGAKRISANLLLQFAKFLDVQPRYFFEGYSAKELRACLELTL